MNTGEFQAQAQNVERAVQRVNSLPEADARTAALELLQSLMDLHGSVLVRVLELLGETEAGRASLDRLAADPLVCGLLVLYGLHPLDLQTRVARALEQVRPRLRKQAAEVELLGISDSVVRVRIQGAGNACGNSPDALKQVVEQAILEAAPEVVEVIADGMPANTSGFVPLQTIQPAMKKGAAYEESAA